MMVTDIVHTKTFIGIVLCTDCIQSHLTMSLLTHSCCCHNVMVNVAVVVAKGIKAWGHDGAGAHKAKASRHRGNIRVCAV